MGTEIEEEDNGIPNVVSADAAPDKQRLLEGFGKSKHVHDHHDHDHGHSDNINIRAAIVHLIGDLIQSIGVIIAAVIIYFFP